MTIQEAAYDLLVEFSEPTSSRELARIALERGLVTSSARDPVFSHASTIEKNIRDEFYNKQGLIFIPSPQGRLIGLPEWESKPPHPDTKRLLGHVDLKVRISIELYEKLRLAEQAKIENSLDDTVSMLLSKGLLQVAPEIEERLIQQVKSLRAL